MTRAELLALAERVEAATGPDRELDAQVALVAGVVPEGAFRPCASPDLGTFGTGAYTHWVAPNYTASIDAAASLVPDGEGFALVYNAAKVGIWTGKGKTPALALLAAALFARAEEAAWNESGDRARAEEAGE